VVLWSSVKVRNKVRRVLEDKLGDAFFTLFMILGVFIAGLSRMLIE
jgi:hypothetical protein